VRLSELFKAWIRHEMMKCIVLMAITLSFCFATEPIVLHDGSFEETVAAEPALIVKFFTPVALFFVVSFHLMGL
jgi:hypothetical protein